MINSNTIPAISVEFSLMVFIVGIISDICEPIAWLSELTKQRDYIVSAIQNLGSLMIS